MIMMRTIAVLGGGSWGTALAVHLGGIGHDVRLWALEDDLVADMRARRTNAVYLPGVTIPDNVSVTGVLDDAVRDTELVVSAIPSQWCRGVIRAAASHMSPNATIVSATKGLEADTLLRMSEVIAQELGPSRRVVVLSGPSFAVEVARGLPTAVLAASSDPAATELVQMEFRGPSFRLYGSGDVAGVEIGGLGHNALAAIITRGLAEITRLACAAGGRRETLAGLSGLGDLVLTCTGELSRNRRVGIELASGRPLSDVLSSMKMVAEGVRTTGVALALGTRYGVELPIAGHIGDILAGRIDVRAAVDALMLRRQRAEAETE
jgi:glycerol-3-phosphate dehydrogenase (NAD(P)+)